jgi:NCAIR mutase (PurE)-related protein
VISQRRIRNLLEKVQAKALSPERAVALLRHLPYELLEFARLDHHRSLRQGLPEVVFCQGKTDAQAKEVIVRLIKAKSKVLATRVSPSLARSVRRGHPELEYDPLGKTLRVRERGKNKKTGEILILSAGTSDIPVAQEARVTAETLGSRVEVAYDVGVAGIHRLLDLRDQLRSARVIVVVAGMDGALPSVVGGLVPQPVIGVPTSTGYGASFGGLSALLAMLNSCAAGLAVVNIDNGFGAGCLAHKINIQGKNGQEDPG